MSVNLIYCPEGGEHEWWLWTAEETGQLRIDCDRCLHTLHEAPLKDLNLDISPLPINVTYHGDITMIGSRP